MPTIRRTLAHCLPFAVMLAAVSCSNAGKITAVDQPAGYVGGSTTPTAADAPIKSNDHVTTNSSGIVKFSLVKKDTLCTEWSNSDVVVEPDGSTLVAYMAGSTTCGTKSSSGSFTLNTPIAVVSASDPVWTLVQTKETMVLRVAKGKMTVTAAKVSRVVETNQQITVTNGQPPSDLVGFTVGSLPEAEQTVIQELLKR